jgi:hypothetical protein
MFNQKYKAPNLITTLREAMISCGEVCTIKAFVDEIMAYEAETMTRLSGNEVRVAFEEAAEGFVYTMQENAWDTVGESSEYTEQDAERDCEFYEAMRPSVIRRKELESL